MSEIILPKYLKDLIEEETEVKQEQVDSPGDQVKARQLPKAVGFKILCAVPPADDKFDDSVIVKASISQRVEEQTTTVLFVVAVGPDAYKDTEKFPSGPWCKKGDWIMLGRYAGARFRIEGGEVRILNDDEIIATIDDPADILNV